MELPADLGSWTHSTVLDLVRTHEFEPGYFDYKEVLNVTNPRHPKEKSDHRESVRRTVCSMANTGGGFILFGVIDRGQSVADPVDRIVGIPLGGELRAELGKKLKVIQPDVYFETSPRPISLPPDEQGRERRRGIFVARIPESVRRPHMVYPPGIFYRRGSGGTAIEMDYYQVRDMMLLRRQSLLANLKWEAEENIAALFRKVDGLPFRLTYHLGRLRRTVALTAADLMRDVQVSLEQARQAVTFWVGLPGMNALKTEALQHAIYSGEFLVQRPDADRLVGDQAYAAMRALLVAIEEFREGRSVLTTRGEQLNRLYQAVRENRPDQVIAGHDLAFLYKLHDGMENILRLSVALLRYCLDPTVELRMPQLNSISPLPEEATKIERETATHADVEAWAADGYLWTLMTGEGTATAAEVRAAMDKFPALRQVAKEVYEEKVTPLQEELNRRVQSEGSDAVLAWLRSVLKQR